MRVSDDYRPEGEGFGAGPETDRYLHTDHLPHMWCAGCGIGTVLGAFLRAAQELELEKRNTVVVTGIGCSSRAAGYLDFGTVHSIHGRALAFATGIKMAHPEFTVIVMTGDGDGAAIGGNHLIHACRRNIDLTCLLLNNRTYGMTGGQLSPMMEVDEHASTAPYGHIERSFDLCDLTQAAGATYVARSTSYGVRRLERLIKDGISHRGFSFVEAVTQCPTEFGKRNHPRDPVAMLEDLKRRSVSVRQAEAMSAADLRGKIVTGVLHEDNETAEFSNSYKELLESAGEG